MKSDVSDCKYFRDSGERYRVDFNEHSNNPWCRVVTEMGVISQATENGRV